MPFVPNGELIKDCKNAVHVKDDILVHKQGQQHNIYLQEVLKTLMKHNATLHPECELGQPKVKWFRKHLFKGWHIT